MLKLNQSEIQLLEKYPRYSQDGLGENAKILFKIFNPLGNQTWYVLEGEKMYDGKDWLLYGYVIGQFNEYGYFTLNELKELRVPCYVQEEGSEYEEFIGYCGVEVDRSFASMTPMGEILKEAKM